MTLLNIWSMAILKGNGGNWKAFCYFFFMKKKFSDFLFDLLYEGKSKCFWPGIFFFSKDINHSDKFEQLSLLGTISW